MLVHSVVRFDVGWRRSCESAGAARELLLSGVLKTEVSINHDEKELYLCFVETERIISGESFAADIAFKRLHAAVQFDVLLQVVVSIQQKL